MTIARWAGMAAMFALALFSAAPQANCDWEMLGMRQVDHRVDHDTITVSKSEESFKSIQLRVEGAPVEFNKVTVYFGNGDQQVVDMRDNIEEGGKTRQIDLEGGSKERKITHVDFSYRTTDASGRKAVVQLWGISA
jgi:hypothetical protein